MFYFMSTMTTDTFQVPLIRAGEIISGKVLKRGDYGILIDCADGAFT